MKLNNNNTKQSNRRYGLLTMISLIVGTVIGSGIFVKNEALYSDTNSALLSMMAWAIISLLVIFVLVSFVEISSITKKKNEQGSLSNWTRHLWGETASKFVGYFFVLILSPILLLALSVFSSQEIINSFQSAGVELSLSFVPEEWSEFILISLFTIVILIIIFTINALTSKPGKVIQTTGTFIKLIPLLFIVFLGIVVLPSGEQGSGIDGVFDPESNINSGLKSTNLENLEILFLALPSVLFAFDGFIYSATLQNEAKSKNTFKISLVFGILLIVILYLIHSLMIFAIGDPNMEGGFTITEILISVFPNNTWIAPVITILIVISILTTISGFSIMSSRAVVSLSLNNQFVDKKGKLISRNKSGVPSKSCWLLLFITVIWFMVLRVADGILLMDTISNGEESYQTYALTAWSTDLVIIFSFFTYAFLILGAVVNRFTKKLEVEKNILFFPASFLSIAIITIITGYFAYDLFNFDSLSLFSIFKIILTISVFVVIGIVWFVSSQKFKKLNASDFTLKKDMINAYKKIMTIDEYRNFVAQSK